MNHHVTAFAHSRFGVANALAIDGRLRPVRLGWYGDWELRVVGPHVCLEVVLVREYPHTRLHWTLQ